MALEMALSPLISLAVNKSNDALVEKICRMWGMDENRETLQQHLLAVQEMIADAQERAVRSPAVKGWLQQLDAVAHEAVDVLDEFQYEALRSEAISQQPSASSKVIKGFCTHENPVLFRYKMSNKLTKVLCKIDKIVSDMNKFKLVRHDPTPAPTIDRETHSVVMESEVIGRECEKEQIVSELLNPQRERENISVLAIVGIGGAGKTTLAQLVFNDKRVKVHFQLSLWVCVSTEFNVIKIIKSIIEGAFGATSKTSKEMLQHELGKVVDKKRYLLVLDDVWNKETEKWNELRTLLCSVAGAGSVIIVTTRDQDVASIMEVFSNHDLKKLSDEDSLRLFEKRAFCSWVDEPTEEHRKIGKTIAHKCGGLPLVVKAMGDLMRYQKELRDWHAISENKVWDGLRLQSTENVLPVLSILKLSYDHLPSHMKQCFAFCAVFPQDYKIERETLVQLWIANDFIPTDGSIENLENRGRTIFNELHHRSFFQNVKKMETFEFSEVTCQMHDLMHDLATEIVANKCFTVLEPNYSGSIQKEVHHLSVGDLDKFGGINNILKQFPNIHTCLINETYRYIPKKKDFYLLKSCSLRALEYQWCKNVPKEIGYMKHIRYLDLSQGSLTTLPETISKLYNLQTLKLSKSKIQELPSEMRYMINLRHLVLNGCSKLECMPIGLGQLKYMQTLTKYVLNSSKGGSIRELSQLNLLSGYISLSGLESIKDREDAQTINLAKKTNLYSLKLKWDETSNEGGTGNSKPILEALMPHDKLKYLHIAGYSGSGFSKWMMEVPIISNLKRLELEQCINCAELPPVWLLPLLEDLRIKKMGNLKSIVGSMCKRVEGNKSLIIFQALKELTIWDLPNLESWHEEGSESVAFPELKTLSIISCPKLKYLPAHMPLITSLFVTGCSEIKLRQISYLPMLSELSIRLENMPLREPDAFRPPKTLEKLRISGYENVYPLEEEEKQLISCQTRPVLRILEIINSNCFLSSGPGPSKVVALEFWKYFTAVESLGIRNCDNLVFWPEQELRSLECLKQLLIGSCRNLTGALIVQQQVSSLGDSSSLTLPQSLPHLKLLNIYNCPELVQIPIVCSKSLEALIIGECPKLNIDEMLAHVITNPTELKELTIRGPTHWRVWPDNMEHLPSLVRLSIEKCPGIESFPPGLPSLQYLGIVNCPALERRCRSGGDYCHLVSPIPIKRIGTDEPKGKSFLKNLPWPCIRGS
ncbi:hypothetical protein LUZ63_013824 [Rhynchospora breviuscula]|uniref:Uncharacterized protein n=1 Tax=Rhynchospora breviuscula TaxID=2022672 RepID=A0A9Q0HKX7_9POAL|nr:hypothetical protein LUZ63_013824 [Rhynchospora breviuscula]